MPIYEFYSPDTNKIYSFYAKTLAQAALTPRCPDDPKARMKKIVSGFAVVGRHRQEPAAAPGGTESAADGADDARMEAAMGAMEREFSNIDENDPRAMARMMRRMADLTGEKFDEPMEEAVRKLEEGADPDSLESEMGDAFGGPEGGDPVDPFGEGPPPPAGKEPEKKEPRRRLRVPRRPPVRDPKLYDYE